MNVPKKCFMVEFLSTFASSSVSGERKDILRGGAPGQALLVLGNERSAPQPAPRLLLQQSVRSAHHQKVRTGRSPRIFMSLSFYP
jgi:hypothetical protein